MSIDVEFELLEKIIREMAPGRFCPRLSFSLA